MNKTLSADAAGGGSFPLSDSGELLPENSTGPAVSRSHAHTELLLAARTAELRASEALYRTLVERAPEAIVALDGDTGLFTEANENALRLFGVDRSTLMKLGAADVSPPTQPDGRCSREAAFDKMKQTLESGGAPMFEWVHRDQAGRDFLCEVRVARVPIHGRNLFIATVTDVSERKALEAKLRQTNSELQLEVEQRIRAEGSLNQRIRISTLNAEVAVTLNARTELRPMLQQCAELVVQHLDVAFARVWLLNEATQILELEASAGCYTHLDGVHSRIQVGQHKIGRIAHEKQPHLTNSVQTDQRVSDQAWAVREGMVAFAGYPLLLEGRVLGVLALFARRPLAEDILKALGAVANSLALGIERKRAQTALAESEARFSTAFQASPVFIAIARMSDGRFVLVNDAFVNWTGHSREDVLGRNTAELSVWEHQADREAFWRDLRRTGSMRERECRFRNRSGKRLTVLLSSEIIQLNNVPHVLAMGIDITERKQAEEELLKTLEREKELGQLKSNFISTVSHEFRTPLGVILSAAQILQRYLERLPVEARGQQLEKISRNAQQLTHLIEEVLMLGKAESGQMTCKRAPLELRRFCEMVLDEVVSAAGRTCPIRFTVGKLSGSARGDERLLRQILANLLSNAVKYSAPGQPVDFHVERHDRDAVMTIRDRGIGIPAEDLPKLFNAFQRASNVGQLPGSGLGLAIVRECVQLHGGRIEVQSKLAEGTTMTVRLPVFAKARKPTRPLVS